MAELLNIPSPLTQPFANNGDKNTIPETNDPSDGLMSQSLGFPPITSKLVSQGGLPPRRADFNGAFNMLSQQHYFLQNGGKETFRQEVSDAIGGYPVNALLWYDDPERGMRFVRSLIPNNTYNFNINPEYIDGSKWEDTITTIGHVQQLFEIIYPVGSIYLTTNATCPLANIFGTWQLVNSGKALWTGNGTNGGGTLNPGLPSINHTHSGTTGNMSANATGGVSGLGTGWGSYNGGGATPVGTGNMTASKTANAPYNQEDGNHYQMGTGSIAINVQHNHSFTTGSNTAVSSIYGASNTVQPPAYIVNAFKRIA